MLRLYKNGGKKKPGNYRPASIKKVLKGILRDESTCIWKGKDRLGILNMALCMETISHQFD